MYLFHHINTKNCITDIYFFLQSINQAQLHEFLMSGVNLAYRAPQGVQVERIIWKGFSMTKWKFFIFTSLQRMRLSRYAFFVTLIGRYIINIFEWKEGQLEDPSLGSTYIKDQAVNSATEQQLFYIQGKEWTQSLIVTICLFKLRVIYCIHVLSFHEYFLLFQMQLVTMRVVGGVGMTHYQIHEKINITAYNSKSPQI